MGKGDQQSDINTETNTDAANVRNQRALTESQLYSQISEMFSGKSLVERITEVREMIFDQYDNIKGDLVTSVRSKDVNAGGFNFIPHEEVGSRFFPALIKRVDELYEHVLEGDQLEVEHQFDRLIRFSAVVYSLGVTLHPYIDANGQTFRVAALSYLSEMLSENFRIPLHSKIRRTVPTALIEELPKKTPISSNTRRKIRDRAYEDLDYALQVIVQLRYKNPTQIDTIVSESYRKKLLLLTTPGFTDIEVQRDELVSEFPHWADYTNYIIEILKTFPDQEFNSLAEIYEHPFKIDIPGFDDITTGIFTHSQEDQIESLRAYLSQVLESPSGYNMLAEYIDNGEIQNPDTHIATLLFAVLDSAASQIFDLSEVDDAFFGKRFSIPAGVLRDKLSGKQLLFKRLRYAVSNVIRSLHDR